MKLIIASALLAVVSAQIYPLGLVRQYPTSQPLLPSPVPTYTPLPSPLPTYNPVPSPVATYAPILPAANAPGVAIPILRLENDAAPDGSHYQFGYETGNGISVQEVGDQIAPDPEAPLRVRGSYSYTSPEGVLVQRSYEADENGFRVSGNDIP
ncbi:hypothetical protein NQ315_004934 [Exocentrus adspersus]|uniref:Uncharacterized protein n=1 Tax=Exocentrus adspersus TaxID=1586481 RepID=A0AAV8W2X6_9CUCU|nr:hypothetical protein NQ315_004934 [Exocentrus adspersus]